MGFAFDIKTWTVQMNFSNRKWSWNWILLYGNFHKFHFTWKFPWFWMQKWILSWCISHLVVWNFKKHLKKIWIWVIYPTLNEESFHSLALTFVCICCFCLAFGEVEMCIPPQFRAVILVQIRHWSNRHNILLIRIIR